MIECGRPLFQAGKSRFHLRCLLAASTIALLVKDVTVAANAIVGMRHVIGHHATIMDISNLTLEVIQQYVGMHNWENVIAFAGVCKSWKGVTKNII